MEEEDVDRSTAHHVYSVDRKTMIPKALFKRLWSYFKLI